MIETPDRLGMWDTWQETVRAALPHFAASPHYVEQDSVSPVEVADVVDTLRQVYDVLGASRDVDHGARAFETTRGIVTRAWVDANIEIDFLHRAFGFEPLTQHDVLDIGAGYGRLAVMLQPWVRSYACVDAVPVSVEVCRTYTQRYAPTVRVFDVAGLRAACEAATIQPTLAINIHSWNECTLAQITGWLDLLGARAVPWLFTVSHGHTADGSSYRCWDRHAPSFRPLLEARYDLVVEESIGLSRHPHALWRRKAGR